MSQKSKGKNNVPNRAKGPWPSVEQQLIDSHVASGSALEKLIRNNQDVHTLHPDEANDQLPFPPWLRLYWRKAHPELDFSGHKVGYPLILKEIGSWMIRHQDLTATSAPDPSPKDSSKPGGKNSARS
jgi:hypothetical protein